MIDAITKQKIYDAANIKEVVEDYIPLRKSGVNYVGLCPFHNDNHPSFVVSPSKNICHCFVCGEGGNPVTFLRKKENLSYEEALRELAKKYRIEIQEKDLTPEEIQRNNDHSSMMAVNEWLNQHFVDNLHNTQEGVSIGMSYLLEKRQLRQDIINKFQLGYALRQKDEYTKTAQQKGYKLDYLCKLGATIKNEERQSYYDRFNGRVIFPIHSISGKVIGFGGRTLISGDMAKYQNSPESDVYQKRFALYGLFFAKRAIQNQKKCYLCEGYCDMISMYQAGIENIVAPCGTALTTEQISILKKVIPSASENDDDDKHVTMMYDGDGAGIHAGMKNGPMLLEQGLRVHVVILPPEDDPDTFAHKYNGEEVKKYLDEHEEDFVLYYAKQFLPEIEKNPLKRSGAIIDTANVIAAIPDKIRRSTYIKECSRILDADEELFYSKISDIIKQKKEDETKRARLKYNQNGQENPQQPADNPLPEQPTAGENQENTTPQNSDVVPDNRTQTETRPIVQSTPTEMYKASHDLERKLMQILIRFFNEPLYYEQQKDGEKVKVNTGRFIVSELERDNIELENEGLKKIKDEIKLHIDENGFNCEKYCLNHINPEISDLACNLMLDRHFPEQDDQLIYNVSQTVMEYKLEILKNEKKQLIEKLKNNPEDMKSIFDTIKNKDVVIRELSNKLGMVIN